MRAALEQHQRDQAAYDLAGRAHVHHAKRIHDEVVNFAAQEAATKLSTLGMHTFSLLDWFEDAGSANKAPLAVAEYKRFVGLPVGGQGSICALSDEVCHDAKSRRPHERHPTC